MSRKDELIKKRHQLEWDLQIYATLMLKDEWLKDDIEDFVKKTLDKFDNECYNIYRKRGK